MSVVPHDSFEFADLPGREAADPLSGLPSQSSARYVRLAYSPGRTAHVHPHSEEVVYVVSGRGHVWIDGDHHPVAPGDVVHIPAGTAHATVPDRDAPMQLMCFFPHPDLPNNIEDTEIAVSEEGTP